MAWLVAIPVRSTQTVCTLRTRRAYPNEDIPFAERVEINLCFEAGGVRQSGSVQEVFSAPADLAVARIVGVDTIERGKVVQEPRQPNAKQRRQPPARAHSVPASGRVDGARLVTNQACQNMGLWERDEIVAMVNAPAIHLIAWD
jgi:hypothetical protein